MSEIKMPEFPDIAPTDDWSSVLECINTYAEAYAAAKVREALERAEMILKANAEACDTTTRIILRANAAAIRELIPQQ